MAYPVKTKKILNVTKDEAQAALVELRREWQQADRSLCMFVKRLQWFREWTAYKHLGHSTFEAFLKAEIGKSRFWLWEHLKTLPIIVDERRLLETQDVGGDQHFVQTQHGLDAENEGRGKLGNLMEDDLKLTHKQRLEIAKVDFRDQRNVVEAVLKECPGGDLETTKKVIAKTVQYKAKPKKPKRTLMPKELEDESPIETFRVVLHKAFEFFGNLYAMSDTKLLQVAQSVHGHCQGVAKAAKALR